METNNVDNPEFRKTILIGLGGAGKLVLTHIKRLFIDTYNVLPPSIKLLSLDTNSEAVALRSAVSEKEYTLDDQETLYMEVEGPTAFIKESPVVRKWFVKPLPAGAIANGAGAVRQVGRVAFFYHIKNFLYRIDTMQTELNHPQLKNKMENAKLDMDAKENFRLSQKSTEIYVCGSLAGGTGSGTFLDVGMLLRKKIPEALIHGFFLLNWVYRNKAFAHRTQGNVYAALTELDNLQSIMYGDKEFLPYQMTYADEKVDVEHPPYDLFHLVDGRNEYGENIDKVEDLCETVSSAIFLSIGAIGGPVASVVDNLMVHINVSDPTIWKGRYARYSSFGVSSIYYPAVELHRLISIDNATRLCASAISESGGKTSAEAEPVETTQRIEQDVSRLLGENQLNILNRAHVQDKICPSPLNIPFPVPTYLISDKEEFPKLIQKQQEKEEEKLQQDLSTSFEDNGREFIDNTRMVLEQKITEIEDNSTLDTAYLQEWTDKAIDELTKQKDEVDLEINEVTGELRDHRDNADSLLGIAENSRYIPGLGGPRKKNVTRWAATVVAILGAIKKKNIVEYEEKFYETILLLLRSKRPEAVYTSSDVLNALKHTRAVLRKMAMNEQENFKILKSKPNQNIIGNGNIVIVPGEEDGISLVDSIDLDYDEFKVDNNIHKAEDFFIPYKEDPPGLTSLFLDYSLRKLEHLTSINVQQAMETIGKKKGDRDGFIKNQFSDLFRMSSALWSFNKGAVTELRSLQYDKIVSLGAYDQQEAKANYDQFVMDVKTRYGIRTDHSFSTTRDPYRIWLLNYAAALPIYFLSDLYESRKKYEEEITPTYHIDSNLEMNVPDLFPVEDWRNRALRVLGMAIVPGIDVIHDEKLTKGHKFTCDADPVKEMNFGDPKTWYLFRDMYDEIIDDYNPDERDDPSESNQLLDILTRLLKEKVGSMGQSELKACIKDYIEKVRNKLNKRDFTRLISARLTYREIKELENFLDRRGYGMDINRYIAGK